MTFVDYDWDMTTCLMFGAMMAATDPVAVVALRAPPRFARREILFTHAVSCKLT